MSYASVIAADSPVAWWRLDDAAGTTAADQESSHPGTYHGGFTLNSAGLLVGDSDDAVVFNGTTGYVSVPFDSLLNTSTFSVEVLVKLAAQTSGAYQAIVSSRDIVGGNTRGYILYKSGETGNLLSFWMGNGTASWSKLSGSTLTTGTIYHIIITYDGTKMHLYVNGVEVGTGVTATLSLNATRELRIGAGQNEGAAAFFENGTIDEVSYYNFALTQSQVTNHYNATLGGSSDTAIISSKTTPSSVESTDFVDSQIVSSKTSVSAVEIYSTASGTAYTESSTISSKTSVTTSDLESYHEVQIVTGITTPGVTVELQTSITIVNDSGAAIVGVPFTSTIEINVPGQVSGGGGSTGSGNVVGGTDTTGGTYVTPTGFWGVDTDDDDGLIP